MTMFKFTLIHYCTTTHNTLGHTRQHLSCVFLQNLLAVPFHPGASGGGMAAVWRPYGLILARCSLLFLYSSSILPLVLDLFAALPAHAPTLCLGSALTRAETAPGSHCGPPFC